MQASSLKKGVGYRVLRLFVVWGLSVFCVFGLFGAKAYADNALNCHQPNIFVLNVNPGDDNAPTAAGRCGQACNKQYNIDIGHALSVMENNKSQGMALYSQNLSSPLIGQWDACRQSCDKQYPLPTSGGTCCKPFDNLDKTVAYCSTALKVVRGNSYSIDKAANYAASRGDCNMLYDNENVQWSLLGMSEALKAKEKDDKKVLELIDKKCAKVGL